MRLSGDEDCYSAESACLAASLTSLFVCVVSFSTAPLRAWFYVGVVIAAIAIFYAIFITTRVLIFGIDTPGYASLLIAVLLMGAIQLLSLGIIGEYIGRIYRETKHRPLYIVEESVGF